MKQANYLEIMAKSKFIITHGGVGAIYSALVARVPMYIVPYNGD